MMRIYNSNKRFRIFLTLLIIGLVVFFFIYFTNFNFANLTPSTVKLEEHLSEIEDEKSNETPASYITQIMKYNAEVEKLEAVQKLPISVESLKIIGWIPDWDLADGFATLQKYDFDTVSPFWLLPQDDGSLKEVLNKANPELITYANENNIEIIPTIPLFDGNLFNKIFNNPESYSKFISDMMSKIEQYGYDGIDLDFEEFKIEDKNIFFTLLKDISQRLHIANKKLIFTALPAWGNEVLYIAHRQTRAVQDYNEISKYVDEFRLMTYDFYGRNAVEAGPVAPLEWMERVIQYTIFSGVPREKIVLGIPTYAYDWSDRSITSNVNLSSDEVGLGSLVGLEPGEAYYYKGIDKVIANYNMEYTFNSEWGEAVGRYIFEGKSRIVVFPTDESIQLRKELAAEYGIKGVAYWRLGDEGTLKL